MTLRGRDVIADWIETALLVRGPRPIGLDALLEFFERWQGLEPQRVNVGIREMERRSRILGARYPFRTHGEIAVQAAGGAAGSTYAAFALLAPSNPVRTYLGAAPDESMALIFENATAAAVRNLWGNQGKALRFGWPSDVGRPPEFDQAVRWLAGKIGVEVGHGYRQPRRKDGGVDVVAWRPFADGRSGFPLVLVQCTLQENLLSKGADVDTRLWGSWLALDVDPTTALATPAALPPGTTWNELALRYMVLDRTRLVGLAEPAVADDLTLDWITQTLESLSQHMEEIAEL